MNFPLKSIVYALLGMIGLGLMTEAAKARDQKKSGRVLRHVVCFKFKENAKPAQIQRVEREFAALKKKIPQIRAFEMGTNNSPEGLDKGFTHCFVVTFGSEKDREIYLPHPAHKKFVSILKPILEDVFVIDFWAGGD
ncbi:MAG: stress responsive protein [Verrucomicrobiales bacterium]|nr:stress responsive protein [Verrucomicrobiales bacterium]|tara:strand:- start:972 stop:1382 length:411 start_codon:yes stop_codon:yes gene_type:complete